MSDVDCKKFIFETLKLSSNTSQIKNDFNFIPTDESEVLALLKSLDNKTSLGSSKIPISILKSASQMLAKPLVDLFNLCLFSNTIPTNWKIGLVTPLFKNKGELNNLNSYRGISVLPPLCKLQEKIIAKQIRNHFESKNLLCISQHGFRAGHSCETALHELISSCLINLDKSLINLLLMIDFKKAFDMLDRSLLIYKLGNYGFSSGAIKLIESYFTDRYQQLKVNDSEAPKCRLNLGVPQGSVLGPLLFLIFINDLPIYLENILSILFADDTTLVLTGKTIIEVTSVFKSGLKRLNEWCKHNRLYINWDKTFIMLITNKRVQMPEFLEFDNVKIRIVQEFKLLGVVIDNKLTFNKFVANQRALINKKLYSIKRLFYLPVDVKLQFFKSFILPYFDYGFTLAIYFSKVLIQKLCKTYFICLSKLFRFSFYNKTLNEINNFLKGYKIFSFHHRFTFRLSIFFHKIIYGKDSPVQLKKWLNLQEKNEKHNLRSNNCEILDLDKSNNKYGDVTFKNFMGKFLNSIKLININPIFKFFIKDLLLNIDLKYKILMNVHKKFDCDLNLFSSLFKKKKVIIYLLYIYINIFSFF